MRKEPEGRIIAFEAFCNDLAAPLDTTGKSRDGFRDAKRHRCHWKAGEEDYFASSRCATYATDAHRRVLKGKVFTCRTYAFSWGGRHVESQGIRRRRTNSPADAKERHQQGDKIRVKNAFGE